MTNPIVSCPRCASTQVGTLQSSKGGTALVMKCQVCQLVGDASSFPVNGVLPQ